MRRNSFVAGRMRWGVAAVAVSLLAALFVITSGAQALVVNDQGATTGVRLVPGSSLPFGLTPWSSSSPSAKPATANPATANPSNAGAPTSALQVRMQLLPQSLGGVLRSGIAARVSANQPATGIANVSISRQLARQLHIAGGRGPAVVIGRGTISTIKNGSMVLHFKLSRSTVAKLKRLRHLSLTLKLQVIGVARDQVVLDAAGRY